MEGNVKVLNYYNHGSAAPTIRAMVEAENRRAQIADTRDSEAGERMRRLEKAHAKTLAKAQAKQLAREREKTQVKTKAKSVAEAVEKTVPGISFFAILGTVFVAVLMVFVVLAQINYNETAAESVRLNMLISDLSARHRALELSFENAVDIKEVERFARDELGMSRPETSQVIIISTTPRDTAMVINNSEDRGLQGFGSFLRSLTEYFRR